MKKINPNCKCPKDCKNHGNCVDCIERHSKKGKKPPFCKRKSINSESQ